MIRKENGGEIMETFLKIYALIDFRERNGETETLMSQHSLAASTTPPAGDWAHNWGMCSERELNQ